MTDPLTDPSTDTSTDPSTDPSTDTPTDQSTDPSTDPHDTQRGAWDEDALNVLVEVFITQNEAEVKKLFTEINSGEAVRLIDMPTEVRESARFSSQPSLLA